MKNKQKGFVIPTIITVIALLAIGVGFYIYTDKGVNEKTTDQNEGDVTTQTDFSNNNNNQASSSSASEESPVACTMDAMQCPDGSYVGRSGPKCEFVCPDSNIDITPPLGNSTLKISCNMEGCNTSGVKSTRSDFYLDYNGKRVKVLIDIETRLRLEMGVNERLQKWADFYPIIDGPVLGMPFSATIYGDWVDNETFKANWIKWTIS